MLLDAGNALFGPGYKRITDSQDTITAQGIMTIYKHMGYSAVNVGPNDIGAGIDFIRDVGDFPWVSACLYNAFGEPLFQPYLLLDINDRKVGVIGITSKPQGADESYIFKDWSTVLPEMIKNVRQKSDFIILLSTLSLEENMIIAQTFPSIRLLVSSTATLGNMTPRLVGNAIITQTEKRGKYLAHLTMENIKNTAWFDEKKTKEQEYLKRKLSAVRSQITNIEKQTDLSTDKKTTILNQLGITKNQVEIRLKGLQDTSSPGKDSGISTSTFSTQFVALSENINEDKGITDIILAVKEEIRSANVLRIKKQQQQVQITRYNAQLAGPRKCGECHEKQTRFWQNTPHAHSFETLIKKGSAVNLDCVVCHVTHDPSVFPKQGEDTLFLLTLHDDFKKVGCESCHGSGRKHSQHPSANTMDTDVPEAVCLNCHTQTRDLHFHYLTKRAMISCPSNN